MAAMTCEAVLHSLTDRKHDTYLKRLSGKTIPVYLFLQAPSSIATRGFNMMKPMILLTVKFAMSHNVMDVGHELLSHIYPNCTYVVDFFDDVFKQHPIHIRKRSCNKPSPENNNVLSQFVLI